MKYFGIIDKNVAVIFQLQWKIGNISDTFLQYSVLCGKDPGKIPRSWEIKNENKENFCLEKSLGEKGLQGKIRRKNARGEVPGKSSIENRTGKITRKSFRKNRSKKTRPKKRYKQTRGNKCREKSPNKKSSRKKSLVDALEKKSWKNILHDKKSPERSSFVEWYKPDGTWRHVAIVITGGVVKRTRSRPWRSDFWFVLKAD